MLNFIDNWVFQGDHESAVGTCLRGLHFIDVVIFLGWDFPHELRSVRSLMTPIIHIPMSDSEQDNEELFTIILNVIDAFTSRNKMVLLCCEAGMSRSPTMSLLYLCMKETWNFEGAEKHIKENNGAYQPEISLRTQVIGLLKKSGKYEW